MNRLGLVRWGEVLLFSDPDHQRSRCGSPHWNWILSVAASSSSAKPLWTPQVADIRQASQGKTYDGFDYTVLDEGNFQLSWAGVSAEELEMCAAHRQLFGGRYGLKRLTRLLERNPGEELNDREELDAERLTTTPLVGGFPPSDDGISSYHSDDSNDSVQLAEGCIRKIYQVHLRENQQRA